MKSNSFKENVIPVLVLVCICLVATLALAATYSAANPVIIQNQKETADEARAQVLPSGDSFTKYDGKLVSGVTECYIADNKSGMAVTAEYGGYGGSVVVMIGIDSEGKVTGVTVTEHSETPGLGTKAIEPDYLKQYEGISEAGKSSIKDDANVDAITGATITSNAVYCSVGEALAQFKECGGVN